jgi:hypothetical protein
MTELLLGLDINTSSSKAVLARPDGTVVASAELVEPDAGTGDVYDELFELYLELYPATAHVSHRLAELQQRAVAVTPRAVRAPARTA